MLNTHSEINLDEEEADQDQEAVLGEYFPLDTGFYALFKNKDTGTLLDSQIVFETNFDHKSIIKAMNKLFGGWKTFVAPYLFPLENIGSTLAKLNQISGSSSKNMLIPPEINLIVEISDEDVSLASIFKFSARVTRKGMPLNGTIMLMSEFLIFFCQSMATSINLLVPYTSILELRPLKNFMGSQNGIGVGTSKGMMEFYVANMQARDQLISKLQISIESLRVLFQSPVYSSLSYRDYYYSSTGALHQISFDKQDILQNIVLRSLKKLKVRYLDTFNPFIGDRVENASIRDVVDMLMDDQRYSFEGSEYQGFLAQWKLENGYTDIEYLKKFHSLRYLSRAEGENFEEEFIAERETPNVVVAFNCGEIGPITERYVIHASHLDQIAIEINSSCSNKLNNFEGLLVISQGKLESRLENPDAGSVYLNLYWKQGLNLFKGASELYGVSWLKRLAFLSKERIDHLKGGDSERKFFLVHQNEVNGGNN